MLKKRLFGGTLFLQKLFPSPFVTFLLCRPWRDYIKAFLFGEIVAKIDLALGLLVGHMPFTSVKTHGLDGTFLISEKLLTGSAILLRLFSRVGSRSGLKPAKFETLIFIISLFRPLQQRSHIVNAHIPVAFSSAGHRPSESITFGEKTSTHIGGCVQGTGWQIGVRSVQVPSSRQSNTSGPSRVNPAWHEKEIRSPILADDVDRLVRSKTTPFSSLDGTGHRISRHAKKNDKIQPHTKRTDRNLFFRNYVKPATALAIAS